MNKVYREKQYDLGGQLLHTVEAGELGRQVAVLIHGWSSSWFATSPLIDLLAQRFHVIAVDLPGYGQSPAPDERITIPYYADTIAKLIQQVSVGPVVMVGHSMGGMISIEMAKRYPVLVERMVLLAPTISGNLSAFINVFITPITILEGVKLGGLIVRGVERIAVGITDSLMRPALLANRTRMSREDYEHIRNDVRKSNQGQVRLQCFNAMRNHDLRGQLNGINIPSLVIWGAEDNTVPLRDAGVVAEEWPEADLRIFPNAGHWPQFECKDVTGRQIAAYLGLPRTSGDLYVPVDDEELVRLDDAAHFLGHSDIGRDLNLAQRTRIAAQCRQRSFKAGDTIAYAEDGGDELYIIQTGTVEVWRRDGDAVAALLLRKEQRKKMMATLRPGQMTGELSLLDNEKRSADLVAGSDGATILTLVRERLLTLCEDDSVLGTQLLWNISRAMSSRVRYILWQLNQAELETNATSVKDIGQHSTLDELESIMLDSR